MTAKGARDFDVAIAGGGMVGASLALALAATERRVVLIEAVAPGSDSQPSFDERTTALGNGARRIYATLGIWEQIAAHAAPIRQIHVSDAGHFGFARLEAAAHDLPAFGYTVGNRHLGTVLWEALRAQRNVELLSPARVSAVELSAQAATLTVQREPHEPPREHESSRQHESPRQHEPPREHEPARRRGSRQQREARREQGPLLAQHEALTVHARLAVAADGAHSLVARAAGIVTSTTDYHQVALVASVRTDCTAQGVAYERFTDSGPVALLPRHDGSYAVIWVVAQEAALALQECSEAEFCERLQQRFGWRAGGMLAVSRRASYPLSLSRARASVGERVALIGNAAQALHPIAAQGFNLGLRDAAVLAELIAAASDPGAPETLAEYARRRSRDRSAMIAFTDQLVKLFSGRHSAVTAARDLGLLLFDLNPAAKRALSRLSWGFGPLPRLSRGLSL